MRTCYQELSDFLLTGGGYHRSRGGVNFRYSSRIHNSWSAGINSKLTIKIKHSAMSNSLFELQIHKLPNDI